MGNRRVDTTEAERYRYIGKAFTPYIDEHNVTARQAWINLLKFNYALGRDKKFTNSFPFHRYSVTELRNGNTYSNMDGYKNMVIILSFVISTMFFGCRADDKAEYYLKFNENKIVLEMSKVITYNGKEVGKIENIEISETVPTYKIILTERIPKESIIKLNQVDLLGVTMLVLYKSSSKIMYAEKDTIIGQVVMKKRVVNPMNVDSLLKDVDSTKKGLLEF